MFSFFGSRSKGKTDRRGPFANWPRNDRGAFGFPLRGSCHPASHTSRMTDEVSCAWLPRKAHLIHPSLRAGAPSPPGEGLCARKGAEGPRQRALCAVKKTCKIAGDGGVRPTKPADDRPAGKNVACLVMLVKPLSSWSRLCLYIAILSYYFRKWKSPARFFPGDREAAPHTTWKM